MNTFIAFVICGLIPLLPFVLGWGASLNASQNTGFRLSAALTALTFFGIGSLKSRWVLTPWWRAGFTTAAVGSAAAALAYLVGRFFHL